MASLYCLGGKKSIWPYLVQRTKNTRGTKYGFLKFIFGILDIKINVE